MSVFVFGVEIECPRLKIEVEPYEGVLACFVGMWTDTETYRCNERRWHWAPVSPHQFFEEKYACLFCHHDMRDPTYAHCDGMSGCHKR